ncbi:hypothetical protein GCM10009682_24210 [Luedemannella flava]|uniref:Phytanoyl-CoA dioxygenase n=1 Tax=Luedemannella flava TaxID=349316 RepID=A0ABN2LWX3_9ACTN
MSDWLTATQNFDDHGYVIIKGALARSEAIALSELAEERWRRRPNASEHYLHEFDFVNVEPRFRSLVAVRSVLGVVTQMLGHNVHVYHCHLTVTQGHAAATGERPVPDYEWHQDGGTLIGDLGGAGAPRVSIKAGFLLSDVPSPQHGPTVMLPRGHCGPLPPAGHEHTWAGAVPITGHAGDCVVFDNRTWHSRSPNLTDQPRVLASVAYAPRWIRSRDRLAPPDLADVDPTSAMAQLLGHAESARGCHVDKADDGLPLLRFMNQN